jgi:hypothetical protein
VCCRSFGQRSEGVHLNQFIEAVKRRVAGVAIDGSTVRNPGAPGVVEAVRAFLSSMPLDHFATPSEESFREALNNATNCLVDRMPPGANSWGLARKCVNIFLRDAFYNHYLRERYSLLDFEKWYEVPLDSHVATKLTEKAGPGKLPKWTTIKGLTQGVSQQYQDFALTMVGNFPEVSPVTARVHLDLYFWRSDDIGLASAEN